METNFQKSTGLSLIIGSTLAIMTMVLHPTGGSIEHIIAIAKPLKLTHSLAIFCLPFILFGFYGLSNTLLDRRRLSILAFIIIAFGLFAAMLAALFNGLVLPYFLNDYAENIEENISLIKPIMSYGFAINTALDYVFIAAFCLAIFVYSLVGFKARNWPKWLGYFGIATFLFASIGAMAKYTFTSLTGFRIIVFGLMGWTLSAGVLMLSKK